MLKPQNTSIPLWLTDFFEEKCIFYIDENIDHMLTWLFDFIINHCKISHIFFIGEMLG